MAKKTEAYVDTSALIAFADRSDTFHPLFRQLFSRPPEIVTTPLVIAEGHAWFLRRYDRTRALQFLAMTESMTPLRIVSVGEKEQRGAAITLRKFSDQDLTIADALGLFLMRDRRISVCWSTDFHLGLGGAELVINSR
jgi:predicted nucleic acid-binding protein